MPSGSRRTGVGAGVNLLAIFCTSFQIWEGESLDVMEETHFAMTDCWTVRKINLQRDLLRYRQFCSLYHDASYKHALLDVLPYTHY